jgi:D-arabinose 1-dehydrogenase-like Zn-dependent alcohol dehydrogenase
MVIQFARLYGVDVTAVSRGSRHPALASELGASQVVDISKGDCEEDWAS